MLRRLHPEQPESFAFTPENRAWAEAQITKYPKGRQASAIIPLLWRAQEQEGWLSRPAIEHVAEMLDMPSIRALEVATFYFMFQLQPVGSVAHVQVCGTTSCMICGAEDLISVCREKIAPTPHTVSTDGKLSWEEVECLGACANAPMAQIGKDYYEDLTVQRFAEILDELSAGNVPRPGPQAGRHASEPAGGLTSLTSCGDRNEPWNASVARAETIGDTIKRIDGTEVPLVAKWTGAPENLSNSGDRGTSAGRCGDGDRPVASRTDAETNSDERSTDEGGDGASQPSGRKPEALDQPLSGRGDDLTRIKGIGPKLEAVLQSLGIWHFEQIAGWSADELAWLDVNLEGFRGRASRDDWVGQAKRLSKEADT